MGRALWLGLVCGALAQAGCDKERSTEVVCPPWTIGDGSQCAPRRWLTKPDVIGESASQPVITLGEDGELVAGWIESSSTSSSVVVAEESTDGIHRRAPGAAIAGKAHDVRVAIAGGRAAALWLSSDGPVVRIQHATRSEGKWMLGEPLGFDPSVNSPELLLAADGEAFIVWNQLADANIRIALAIEPPGAERFTPPADAHDNLSPPVNHTNFPKLARNQRGDALIAWYQAAGLSLRTFVSERWGHDGQFSRPKESDAISADGSDVEAPAVDIAEDGRAAVAWRQITSDGKQAVFLALRDAFGQWTKPRDIDDAFSRPTAVAWKVRVAFAKKSGDLFIAWQERSADDHKVVFVAHQRPDGTWLAPGTEPVRLSDEGWGAYDPSLAVGEHGVLASWSERRDKEFRVVARRSFIDAGSGSEAERWGSATVLSTPGVQAGESQVAIGGGDRDRAACIWTEGGKVRLAVID